MQIKPLINCADTKGIMIKLMLCVIAVLSLTMFIPQTFPRFRNGIDNFFVISKAKAIKDSPT